MRQTEGGWVCGECRAIMDDPKHLAYEPECDHSHAGHSMLPTAPMPEALAAHQERKLRLRADLMTWPTSGAGVRVRVRTAWRVADLVAHHPSAIPENLQQTIARACAALVELAWNGGAVRDLEPSIARVNEAVEILLRRHKEQP